MNTPSIALSLQSSIKSSYNVLIEYPAEGKVTARILGWPECHAEGTTKEGTLQQLNQILTEQLRDREIVSVDVEVSQPQPQREHPCMKFVEQLHENPLLEEVLEFITNSHQEIDEETKEYYRQIDAEVES
jgi:predicted RNase H-like HicB family nuclease